MTDNELIAEFDGLKLEPYNGSWCEVVNDVGDTEAYFEDELEYNTSWDWLMPVVEKIENILSKPNAVMVGWDHWKDQFNGEINTDIKVAYSVVVEFIKWYGNV